MNKVSEWKPKECISKEETNVESKRKNVESKRKNV